MILHCFWINSAYQADATMCARILSICACRLSSFASHFIDLVVWGTPGCPGVRDCLFWCCRYSFFVWLMPDLLFFVCSLAVGFYDAWFPFFSVLGFFDFGYLKLSCVFCCFFALVFLFLVCPCFIFCFLYLWPGAVVIFPSTSRYKYARI